MCQPSSFYTRRKFILRRNGVHVQGRLKSVDTHFCQWLGPTYLHSTFASNMLTMHVHSPDSVNISCSATEQQYCFTSNRVKSTLRASSGTIQDAYVLSLFLDESLALFLNVAFLCKTLFCNSLCTLHSLFSCLFLRLGCFLLNFYLFYFQAVND